MKEELLSLIGKDETTLWEGKPNKKCFIIESIFNPFLLIALVWGIIDFSIIKAELSGGAFDALMLVFFLFHLMPVWIYLFGILFTIRRYKNLYYIVTDAAVYISRGVFVRHYDHKPLAELSHINLHRGIFDQWLNVGDVVISTNQLGRNNVPVTMNIIDIDNYTEVYNLIKKAQQDIYSDTMYPNDLRPNTNHGYKTKYTNNKDE